MGLTVDQHGNILVADSNNHCIRRINKNGFFIIIYDELLSFC